MTFGIHIGHMGGPLSEMRRLWTFADDVGFDWFSVSDHFQESPPQGGDLDCFEAVTTMTAAALARTPAGASCGAPPSRPWRWWAPTATQAWSD
jgi:alkanesulfonate monooxygenase SsuD/methylene tetrahydromethanopterin reductase-like flavin-dependent oxidoreductase (luciferase family)